MKSELQLSVSAHYRAVSTWLPPGYGKGRRSVKGEGRSRGRSKQREEENSKNLDAKTFLDLDPMPPSSTIVIQEVTARRRLEQQKRWSPSSSRL
ncbi:hypothetical protein B296_00050384 [Ensete ventricosum]|uniref:Uncharacterized protein n=1 Tax=Ensete ventricosum TaxID=4639 RepID=A0A426YLH0_ENSVE|nr:hypothetical protein B296_00050384 [Ensete ventricosum]